MGVSSSKSKTTNKPIYSGQIEGASSALTSSYNTNMPKIQAASDQVTGLVPGMIDKYKDPNSNLRQAEGYNNRVLGGEFLDAGNPYLEQMVSQTNNNIGNQMGARLAKLGLGPAGSSYQGVVSREMGKNELGMRYSDYGSERDRMATAAGQAPGLVAADGSQVQGIMAAADAANNPLRASVGYSSGLGGLLGQYQDTRTKTTQPWGAPVLAALSNAAAAYAGG